MKKYIVGLCVGLLSLSSCANQLDVTPPGITDEQVKEILASGDEEKIKLVMAGLVEGLPANFNANNTDFSGFTGNVYNHVTGFNVLRDLEANDIVFGDKLGSGTATFDSEYQLGDFRLADNRGKNYPYWMCGAACINNANKVLAYLDVNTVGENKLLKDYRARCLVIRAWGYHWLMENYQDAYLQGGKEKLGMSIYEVYGVNKPVARSTSDATYEFIRKDIDEAIQLFNIAGITYTTKEDDIDMGVAQFVLARIASWTGDWKTVASACGDILAHYPVLISEENYGVQSKSLKFVSDSVINKISYSNVYIGQDRAENNAFTSITKNPEVILGYKDGSGAQTYQHVWFNVLRSGTDMRVDNRLFDKIATTDYRKGVFLMDSLTVIEPTNKQPVTNTPYSTLKWAARVALGQSAEKPDEKLVNVDQTMFRSSEALLMKAEAEAMSGSESAAKKTLNVLLAARTKVGATPLTCDTYPSMAGLTALQMVQLQTRIELWGENGREFYNNKRWGIPVNRSDSKNHSDKINKLSVKDMTLQIPKQELDTNPQCIQN